MNERSFNKILYICTIKDKIKMIQATRGRIKDKRKVILNATLSLITTNGFHGTSMKLIADTSQIAAGTIYVYFSNKEEMIIALYQEIGEEINQIITRNHNNEVSFFQNFMTIWTAILKFYIADPRKPEFITQYAYSPYITSKQSENKSILLAPIQAIFEKAKKEKFIKNMPIPALIALSHSPITSLVRMAKYEQLQLADLEVKQYAKACWDAIKINSY